MSSCPPLEIIFPLLKRSSKYEYVCVYSSSSSDAPVALSLVGACGATTPTMSQTFHARAVRSRLSRIIFVLVIASPLVGLGYHWLSPGHPRSSTHRQQTGRLPGDTDGPGKLVTVGGPRREVVFEAHRRPVSSLDVDDAGTGEDPDPGPAATAVAEAEEEDGPLAGGGEEGESASGPGDAVESGGDADRDGGDADRDGGDADRDQSAVEDSAASRTASGSLKATTAAEVKADVALAALEADAAEPKAKAEPEEKVQGGAAAPVRGDAGSAEPPAPATTPAAKRSAWSAQNTTAERDEPSVTVVGRRAGESLVPSAGAAPAEAEDAGENTPRVNQTPSLAADDATPEQTEAPSEPAADDGAAGEALEDAAREAPVEAEEEGEPQYDLVPVSEEVEDAAEAAESSAGPEPEPEEDSAEVSHTMSSEETAEETSEEIMTYDANAKTGGEEEGLEGGDEDPEAALMVSGGDDADDGEDLVGIAWQAADVEGTDAESADEEDLTGEAGEVAGGKSQRRKPTRIPLYLEDLIPAEDAHATNRPLTFAFFFQGSPGGNGAVPAAAMRRINIVAAAARSHHPGSTAWFLTDAKTKTAGLHPEINVFRVKNLSPRPGRVLLNRLVAEVRFLRKLAVKEKATPGSADHVVFLDATDVVLLKPIAKMLRKVKGARFDLAMPYHDLMPNAAGAGRPEPSVSPALRFIPGSRLLRAAQFLDSVRSTYLVSYPPAAGKEAEGFRNEQRAYVHVLQGAAGFRPELFKRGSRGFLLRAPVADGRGALNGTGAGKPCVDAAACPEVSAADVALMPPVGSATVPSRARKPTLALHFKRELKDQMEAWWGKHMPNRARREQVGGTVGAVRAAAAAASPVTGATAEIPAVTAARPVVVKPKPTPKPKPAPTPKPVARAQGLPRGSQLVRHPVTGQLMRIVPRSTRDTRNLPKPPPEIRKMIRAAAARARQNRT